MTNANKTLYNPNQNDPYILFNLSDSGGTNTYATAVTYEASASGLLMTLQPTYTYSGYSMGVAWRVADISDANLSSPGVVAVQQQARPGYAYFHRKPGSGTVRTLPLTCPFGSPPAPNSPSSQSIFAFRDMRYYLSNQTALDAYYTANDSGGGIFLDPDAEGELFNYYADGGGTQHCNGFTSWGRSFVSPSTVQFFFGPAATKTSGQYVNTTFAMPNSTPPFRLVYKPNTAQSYNGNGMFAKNNTLRYDMEFDPAVTTSGQFIYTYAFTDYFGNVVGSGNSAAINYSDLVSFPMTGTTQYKHYILDLNPPASMTDNLTGWFTLKVSLIPNPQPYNILENADDAEFGIYNPDSNALSANPYLANAPVPFEQDDSDPGISSLLGTRAVRISSPPRPVELSPPYTNSLDTSFINRYTSLDNYTYPSGASAGAPKTVLFGSIVQSQGRPSTNTDIDQTFYLDINTVAGLSTTPGQVTPYAQPLQVGSTTYYSPFAYWSLTNEPEDKTQYKSTSDIQSYYVPHVLGPGSKAIKDAYAGTGITPIVIGPNLTTVNTKSTNNGPFSWIKDLLDAQGTDSYNQSYQSGAKFLDAFGIHTYTGYDASWEENGAAENIKYLRTQILDALVGGNPKYPDAYHKPIWITEHGWVFSSHQDKPRLQASYIVRRFALAAALGIPNEQNSYFYPTSHGYSDYYLWDSIKQTPNRGGMAMRILNEQTNGKTFAQDLLANYPNAKYVHAISYTNTASDTIVTWGDDFLDPTFVPSGQSAVTLNFMSSQLLHVFNIMGNDITPSYTMSGSNYVYAIPATSSPVYVNVAHNAIQSVSGWPLLSGETNYAVTSGATAANSSTSAPVPFAGLNNGGFAVLNDASWQYDAGVDTNKKVWVSDASFAQGSNNTAMVNVQFSANNTKSYTIDTVVATVPSSNAQLCGVRDYDIQVYTNTQGTGGGGLGAKTNSNTPPYAWVTVKSVRGNTSEWVLAAHFAPMNVKAVQMIIRDVNDGSWLADKNKLTYDNLGASQDTISPLRAMVYELEAYGPANQ